MKKQQGFTLIELMIVVAIIGILAAIAIPAYQDYTIRAKVSEPITFADAAKTSVSEYYQSQGGMPADMSAAGIQTTSSPYIASVSYSPTSTTVSVITIKTSDALGGTANSKTIKFTGTGSNSSVQWVCRPGDNAPMPKKYLPANCRG